MKSSSYLKKLALILVSNIRYRKRFLIPNLYLFNLNPENLANVGSILFELNDPEFMHLGDHLFFIPLVKALTKNGYRVEVHVSPLMYDVFKKLDLPVTSQPSSYSSYDLVISRFELVSQLSKHKSLLVNVSKNLTMPICSQLLDTFSKYFKREFSEAIDTTLFKNPLILEKFNIPEGTKLVLLSLYCDSSSYLITSKKREQLLNIVSSYAQDPHYDVVLVGTEKDRKNHKLSPAFRFHDLRGRTSIIDLFELVNHPRTMLYVGFDSFVMHLFSLAGKNSIVKFRGRISKRQSEMLSKYHVQLFNEHHYVSLV